MRLMRIIFILLFFAVTAVFGWVYAGELLSADNTLPSITIDGEMLDVSIKATNEDLLKGVTAYDEKDGDLTSKVFVESVSKFYETGVCKVTYAVCDSNNHVAKASRKIRYTDYVSPKFDLKKSTCYSLYETINLSDDVVATDCIDGNISKSIIMTSENYSSAIAGVFSLNVSVTNSNGDTSSIILPLIIEDRNLSAPKIELSDYMIYSKAGTPINFADFVVSAMDSAEQDIRGTVRIESTIDFNTPGTYSVHYYATDATGLRGHSVLVVVIEG